MLEEVKRLFGEMLGKYQGGISNTSTAKYNDLKAAISRAVGVRIEDVYATGASDRISNLDTRLPQGNQRNQNTPLAAVFVNANVKRGETDDVALERVRRSFVNTCEKFVSGEERGTTFDGILGFAQLNGTSELVPLVFLHTEQCAFSAGVLHAFPGIVTEEIARVGVNAQAPVPDAQTSFDLPPVAANIDDLLRECVASLAAGNLQYSEALVARFLASLLTKRFVILAGLSGSGKTKLALCVGKWMEEVEGQVEVVAVGADWTSNESVLGYRDALDPEAYRRPTNGALDLILRASNDPSRPHFLILDEMNLSHVERYFADLLSAIESGQPIALHAADGPVDGVPPRVLLPPNLFVIGTVNVDETTYAFSPKVLDRANVIEFRLDRLALESFLAAPAQVLLENIERRGAHFGLAFVNTATSRCSLADFTDGNTELGRARLLSRDYLLELFAILHPIGAEFGFRTAFEVDRFICIHARLCGPTWTAASALDAQVLQKLLPKLHGPERRLRPVLQRIAEYCGEKGLVLSHDKAARMLERLKDGYVSYLE